MRGYSHGFDRFVVRLGARAGPPRYSGSRRTGRAGVFHGIAASSRSSSPPVRGPPSSAVYASASPCSMLLRSAMVDLPRGAPPHRRLYAGERA